MSTMTQTQTQVVTVPSKAAGTPSAVRRPGLMSRALVIGRRELFSHFVSPFAYVAMVLFLFACGGAFYQDFNPGQPAMMRHLFDWMLWFLCLFVPMLSMGSIAQDYASGTI